jgi:hypothetical protein
LFRVTHSRSKFKKTEFDLGKYSLVVGWLALMWLLVTSICFLLPMQKRGGDEWENVNFTPFILGIVSVILMLFWNLPGIGAKYSYSGPKIMRN